MDPGQDYLVVQSHGHRAAPPVTAICGKLTAHHFLSTFLHGKRIWLSPISLATLDNCPPELCQHIFQFACTDDGTTGRTLSFVSKYIHSSSKLSKLQSVSISGADQATRFVLALQRTPNQCRRVSYLTIVNDLTIHAFLATNKGQLSASPSPSSFVRTTMKRLELGVHYYDRPCMQTNRRQAETVFIASLQILHLASATLQTLNIDFQSM